MANLRSVVSYGSSIQSLMEELKKLNDEIDRVHLLVEAEGRNQRVPLPRVKRWLEVARQTCDEINRFLSIAAAEVGNGCNSDLKLRKLVSTQAREKTRLVVQLIKNGGFRAGQIACPPLPPGWFPHVQASTEPPES